MTEPKRAPTKTELARMLEGFVTIGDYILDTGDTLTISPAGTADDELIRVAGPTVEHEESTLPAALFGYMLKLVDVDPRVVALTEERIGDE